MRLLGWKEDGPALPAGEWSPARAGLMEEAPELFRDWIDHLTQDPAPLREWREALGSGHAAVILTGQQPALLGGPLYTLYKTLTALEAARRMRESGRPAVAAFWCVGDDTDHGEVAFTSWPLRAGPPRRSRDEIPSDGSRIGILPVERFDGTLALLQGDWPRFSEWDPFRRLISEVGGATWAAFLKDTLMFLAGREPLLFIDGNDPHTISASQDWLRRFAPERAAMAHEIERLAAGQARDGEDAPLSGEEARRSLFVIEGAGRKGLAEAQVPDPTATLLPNVVLRPALQEYLLPVARVVCGEAEIAYRRLLGPAYERTGRQAAPLMRRFAATLFPPAWAAKENPPDPVHTLDEPDAVLEELAQGTIDVALLSDLDHLRSDLRGRLLSMGDRLALLDRSLSQVLESAVGKIDYQISRIEDAARSKARASLYRRYPELAHLREFLLPRGKAQERSFMLWTPFLWDGARALDDLRSFVRAWFDRGECGHAILALEEEGRR